MSKYAPLAEHLRGSSQTTVYMTFGEIERVLGTKLPPSAFKHRAWWSNNPTNSVITNAWLEAGYKTANVDMLDRTLEFRRLSSDAPSSGAREPRLAQDGRGSSPGVSGFLFSRVFGALQGTVTILPGTDLTSPVEEEWDAVQ